MKVLLINSVCGIGSTGRICVNIAQDLENNGHIVKIAYGRNSHVPEEYRKYAVRIGSDMEVRLHGIKSRLLDAHGLGSVNATKEFLKWADSFKPDLLWLHNIHGYYINYELLFDWIKLHPELEVKWTLHDCWAFTGHCSYFTAVNCNRWKSCCSNCPQKNQYPASILIDNSKKNYFRKMAAFTGVKRMTLITPSQWLADLVAQSYLKEYSVEVHHNTIDKSIFKPTQGDFRKRYNLERKYIVLGVANIWEKRKGLEDFVRLQSLLGDRYRIVLVGLNDKQLSNLPDSIIGIKRTNSQEELAEIYTTADVFVNPTYEDNYPTVNLEAQACGTAAITYNTGGSSENVPAENVIKCGDINALLKRIKEICESE